MRIPSQRKVFPVISGRKVYGYSSCQRVFSPATRDKLVNWSLDELFSEKYARGVLCFTSSATASVFKFKSFLHSNVRRLFSDFSIFFFLFLFQVRRLCWYIGCMRSKISVSLFFSKIILNRGHTKFARNLIKRAWAITREIVPRRCTHEIPWISLAYTTSSL